MNDTLKESLQQNAAQWRKTNLYRLENMIKAGERAREKMIAGFSSAPGTGLSDALYTLKWASSPTIDIALGVLGERGLLEMESDESLAAPYGVLAELRETLLRNSLRASSTSGFSNEVEHAQRQAAAQFLGDFRLFHDR